MIDERAGGRRQRQAGVPGLTPQAAVLTAADRRQRPGAKVLIVADGPDRGGGHVGAHF